MPLGGAVVAGLAPVLGGALGSLFSKGSKKKQEQAMRDALAQFTNIHTPTVEEQKLDLEKYTSAGQLNPESTGTVDYQDTGLSDIQVDPRLKDAQRSALQSLLDQGKTGLSATDRVALNESRNKISGDENARQAAILQNMQQRGIGGSGNELAARLASSQSTANNASAEGDRLLAMAQRGQLEALAQGGNLAGQMGAQDFSQQAQVMSAQDRINQMRSQNSQSVLNQNVAGRNAAQQYNLGSAQNISNQNVGLSNAEQEHNKALLQQQFANQMGLAQNKSALMTNQAAAHGKNAQDTAGQWAKIGAGAGQAIGGIAGMPSGAKVAAPVGAAPVGAAPVMSQLPTGQPDVDYALGLQNSTKNKMPWEQ